MTARNDLIDEYGRADTEPLGTLADLRQKLDAYRAEVLAEDGQAYDGELAMLRGLVATMRVVAEHGDLSNVRKLLAEFERDEAEGKSSRPAADATPDKARCPVCRLPFEDCTCGGDSA
ncbi:hypothetical protein [Streptomyces sp. STR69]|uniref:hypothetical protein n=1 Tax=Streptomyces sp. STR69 TaxID=1796942 RepID=UPI0021C87674|nr:hypothetical protein [Streptomyces sp. STR69]